VSTRSVRLIPACAREPGRFREPDASASPAVGVGHAPVELRVLSIRLIPRFPSGSRWPAFPSRVCGVGQSPRACFAKLLPVDGWPALIPLFVVASGEPFGVSHEKQSLAFVRRAHVGRAKHLPFRIVPARGQVSEDALEAPNSEGCDVLHEHVARSKLANDSGVFAPQSRPSSADADPLSGVRNVDTREPSTDQIDRRQRGRADLAHVAIPGDGRPVFREHGAAERIDLHLPRAAEAGALEAQVKPADAGEQGAERERHDAPPHHVELQDRVAAPHRRTRLVDGDRV